MHFWFFRVLAVLVCVGALPDIFHRHSNHQLSSDESQCNQFTSQDALLVIDVQNDFMDSVRLDQGTPEYSVPSQDQITKDGHPATKSGAIAVANTESVIAPINTWVDEFSRNNRSVFFSLDWHPIGHCSFCRNGSQDTNPSGFLPSGAICGPLGSFGVPANFNVSGRCSDVLSETEYRRGQLYQWPDHCVGGSSDFGVRFSPYLNVPANATVVMKGFDPVRDSYSAWQGTQTTAKPPFWDSTEDVTTLSTQPSLAYLVAVQNIRRLFVTGIATDFCVKNSALDALAQRFGDVIVVQSAARGVTPAGVQAAIKAVQQSRGYVTSLSAVTPQDALKDFCSQKYASSSSSSSSSDKAVIAALAVLTSVFGLSTVVMGVLLVLNKHKSGSLLTIPLN